jgi:hypothetical protein
MNWPDTHAVVAAGPRPAARLGTADSQDSGAEVVEVSEFALAIAHLCAAKIADRQRAGSQPETQPPTSRTTCKPRPTTDATRSSSRSSPTSRPLAHLPSGSFAANSAWLVLAAIAFNLIRAAGSLASIFYAKATTATIRAQLTNIAALITRSARRSKLRLPAAWPWTTAWQRLFTTAIGPPTTA